MLIHSVKHAVRNFAEKWIYNNKIRKIGRNHATRSMGTDTYEQWFDNITVGFDDPTEAILLRGHAAITAFPFNFIRMATVENSVESEWIQGRLLHYHHLQFDIQKAGHRYVHVELTPSEYKEITGETWHHAHITDDYVLERRRNAKRGPGGRPMGIPLVGTDDLAPPVGTIQDTDFDFESPGLPLLELLVARNCYDQPKHALCLPVIPQQWACVLEALLSYLHERGFPFDFCDSDEYCTRWFFFIERPPTEEKFLIFIQLIDHIETFISFKRIANGFIWFFLALGFIAPAGKLFLEILRARFPTILGPFLDWILDLYPDTFSFRKDTPCLLAYLYDAVLLLVLGILFLLLIMPFINWILEVIERFIDVLSTIESINGARKDTIENAMNYSLYHQAYQSEANAGLRFRNDPAYLDRNSLGLVPSYPVPAGEQDPMNRMPYGMRQRQLESMKPPQGSRVDLYAKNINYTPYQQRGGPSVRDAQGDWLLPGADNKDERLNPSSPLLLEGARGGEEHYWNMGKEEEEEEKSSAPRRRGDGVPMVESHQMHDPDEIDEDTFSALSELRTEIHDSLRFFGLPSESINQAQLNQFERHWGAFLHTFHTTIAWQSRVWNEHRYRRQKNRERNPAYGEYSKTVTYNRDSYIHTGGQG